MRHRVFLNKMKAESSISDKICYMMVGIIYESRKGEFESPTLFESVNKKIHVIKGEEK